MNRKTFLVLVALGSMYLGSTAIAADKVADDTASIADFIPQGNDQTLEQEAPKPQAQAKQTQDDSGSSDKRETGLFSGIANAFQGTKNALLPSTKEIEPIKRSNAAVFDIAGVMLRMNRQQVEDAITKHGYRRISASLEIPNFIRWRYEEMCRNKNITGYERLNSCVVKMAQKNNYQYVEHMIFSNFRTKEMVSVNFTSNFTGNKAYFIEYKSAAAEVKGSGQ